METRMIRDGLPLVSMVNPTQERMARRKGIPLFKGVLYEQNDDGYGNPVLRKVNENTVVLGGAVLALEHLCNAEAAFKPATLNAIHQVNSSIAGDNTKSFIKLFGVGIGGAGLDFGNVKAPDVKQREIVDFVPLRTGVTVTGLDSDKYYFKKQNQDGTTFNWYLKEFEEEPVIKSLWKDAAEANTDGTEILEEIFDSERVEGIESFAEFKIKLNVNDIREYFESIGELDMARYNSLGLFTGEKVDVGGGVMDYVNVRLFSVVNFDNRSVKDKSEAIYIYRIFSLI